MRRQPNFYLVAVSWFFLSLANAVASTTMFMWPLTSAMASIGPYGSEVFAITFDPIHSGTIYIATAGAGILKSIDRGMSWDQVPGPTESVVYSFGLDVHYPLHLRAGTASGLYRSNDGGRTWDSTVLNSPVISMAIDPNDSNVVYVCHVSATGVSKTTDGGLTYRSVLPNQSVFALAMDPNDSQIVYAATAIHAFERTGAVWKTTDAGDTWHRLPMGLTGQALSAMVVDFDSTTVYVGGNGNSFRSIDRGETWEIMPSLQGLQVSAWALDANHPGTVYGGTGSSGVLVSRDSGTTWHSLGRDHAAVYSLAVDPFDSSHILAGATTDLFETSDRGRHWSQVVSTGLSTRPDIATLTVRVDPANQQNVYVLGGGVWKTGDGGQTWSAKNRGLRGLAGYALLINPSDSTTLYLGIRFGGGIYKSENSAESWQELIAMRNQPVQSLAIHLDHPQTIYAGTSLGDIFRSADGGATWEVLLAGDPAHGQILGLAIKQQDSRVIYAGTARAGVYKSINGGKTWCRTSQGLPSGNVWYVVPSYLDDRVVYAAVTGRGIFKSIDAGANWFAVNTGITNLAGRWVLTMDPFSPDIIYASSDLGVYKTTTGGSSWSMIGLERVYDLTIDPNHALSVYAATVHSIFASHDGGVIWQ